MLSNLITDRKSDDTYYNYTDLNRVEKAVEYIAALLNDCGYYITIETKTDWNMKDFSKCSQMNRYIENIRKCINQFCKVPSSMYVPTSIDDLDYIGANYIEKVLQDIEFFIANMKKEYIYAGTFSAGEGVVL